ncbi:excisionase family DNA-binding protein [Actinokineospora sp.]|uniref:excisionase family DNA-binding protein n=1 Tax=Actinokineospora sp. TaxID=1872133 RepID=UPI003D6C076E
MTAINRNELASLIAQVIDALTQPEPPIPPPAHDNRVLFTVEEAAQQLRIGKTRAWQLISTGELQSVQIGRLRRIHRDAITAYAAALISRPAA